MVCSSLNKMNNVALSVMITGLGLGSPLQFLPQLSWLCSPRPPMEVCVTELWNFLPFFFFFTQCSMKRNTLAVISSCSYTWETRRRGKRKKTMLLPDKLMKADVTIKASPWNTSSWSRNILLPGSRHWVEAGREAVKGDLASQADVKLLFPSSRRGGDGRVASEHTSSSPVFFVRTLISCSLC